MEHLASIDLWIALGVVAATALTDAVCVLFTSSIIHRKDVAAANWSALSYMLSAFAVISFTNNWVYVLFAALGSWIGAYATMKVLHRRPVVRVAQDDKAAAALGAAVVEPASDLVAACNRQPLPPATLPSGQRFAA
jgi:hypothetical protein